MTVIVGAMPDSHWEQLTPLLERLGWREPQEKNSEDWYRSRELIPELSTNNRYLLLHARPEVVIANTMYSGVDPDVALKQWQVSAQHLLHFYKHNRRQSLLLEVDSVRKFPLLCLDGVRGHFELDVKGEGINLQATDEAPPIYQLLASQFVIQANFHGNLLPELQACTFPLSDDSYTAPKLGIAELHRELLKKGEIDRKNKRDLVDVQEENNLLFEQLYRVQEGLEALHLKNEEKTSEIKKLVGKVEEKDKKIKNNIDARNKDQESIRRLQKSLEKTNRELNREKVITSQLRNSTSWKITAPIRAVKLFLFAKKNK